MTTIDPTAIVVHLDRTGEDGGWNWAEAATSQRATAAEQAGLTVEFTSVEVYRTRIRTRRSSPSTAPVT